jgi:hypothetical protein
MIVEGVLLTRLCPVHERLPGLNFPYLRFVVSVVHFLLWPAVAGIEKEQMLLATGVFEEQSVAMISFVPLLFLAVAEHYCLGQGGLL